MGVTLKEDKIEIHTDNQQVNCPARNLVIARQSPITGLVLSTREQIPP